MNCQDDLTATDLSLLPPTGQLASASTSSTASLFPLINFAKSHALNLQDPDSLPRAVRPIDSKDAVKSNDEVDAEREAAGTEGGGVWEAGCFDSQHGDDEVLVHIGFTDLVRIKSVLLGTGGGQLPTSPRRVKVWVNRPDGVTFDEVADLKPEQEFVLLEGSGTRGAVEYPVRMSRFGSVSSVDLFFSDARDTDHSRVYFLGFLGESRVLKKDPDEAMTVGAGQAMDKMVDSIRNKETGGQASVR